MALMQKIKRGLFMTHTELIEKVRDAFTPELGVSREVLDALEEGLLGADVGAELTMQLMDRMETEVREERVRTVEELTAELRKQTRALVPPQQKFDLDLARSTPFVILVVGVNGTGKTTTIAKLARRFTNEGRSVLLGAADTFRAAAIEQLQMWADRVNVPLVKHQSGSDPAAVAHDSVSAAKARRTDVLIIDTAGRLHNKGHLMQELSKVRRVIDREMPGAPHETLLVIDGTTGQNGVSQARAFLEAAHVTGLVVTKLDGTAKGGVILSIMREFDIPVKFIGVGEAMDDLVPFDPDEYVEGLFHADS